MIRRLLSIVVPAVLVPAALLLGVPGAAAADDRPRCLPFSDEEKVVGEFARAAVVAGPPPGSSALHCGNRYAGLRRIAAEWEPRLGEGWRAAVDAAIARALAHPAAVTYEARSNTWAYAPAGGGPVVVVRATDGRVITVRP